MREFGSNNHNKEVGFKATKKVGVDVDQDEDLDDVETLFVRRLKKGTNKYIGKIPLLPKYIVKVDNHRIGGDDINKRGEEIRDKPKRIFFLNKLVALLI